MTGMLRRMCLLAAGLLLVMISCKPVSDLVTGFAIARRTLPLDKVETDKSSTGMQDRLSALRNVALELGWTDPALPSGFLKDSEEALGYLVVRSLEGKDAETLAVWSTAERDSVLMRSAEKGYQVAVSPLFHCRPWIERASPVPLIAAKWTDPQLGEWLVWEWAAKKLGTDTPQALSAVSYVAWRFNETLITRMQGPGSLELARWRESVRDLRTFQLLVSDLKEQVKGVIAAHPEAADQDETLHRIERNWLNAYRETYSGRFITNLYLDFGKDGWVSPLALETIAQETLGWKQFDAKVPETVKDAQELLRILESQ